MKNAMIRMTLSCPLSRAFALLAATVTCFCALLPATRAEDAPSRVHALFNFEVADKYLTPRGMIVQDHGATFQTLFLAFVDVYHGDPGEFINGVTFIPGFWNDFATSPIASHLTPNSRGTTWVEYDPILGVEIAFAKNFKLGVTYTEFAMQILDIGTSQHLETKLSYDDSPAMGAYAMHPYISYWDELAGKATAAANFRVPRGTYIEAGVAPGWSSGKLKFEVPLRVLLPDKNFYGQTFASRSTVGLYEAGLKLSSSATFMPKGYGHWNYHVGFKYVKFVDKNLQQLATDGGFGRRTRDTGQIYGGISSFF